MKTAVDPVRGQLRSGFIACGRKGVKLREVTRSFGHGLKLLVIERIPMRSCPHCGESYFTAQTMHEIERIKALHKSVAADRSVPGAEFRELDLVEDVDALEADRVLVATDGYDHGLVAELADLIWPTRGQVVVSEPLDRLLYDRPHYARQGFDYWQQLPDGRVLLGGFRDTSILDELTDVEETTPAIQSSLEAYLRELVGAGVRIERRWAGIFGLTQDMLPLVGTVPGRDRLWVAAGYSGHGNVLAFACGELVADAILGRGSAQLELPDPEGIRPPQTLDLGQQPAVEPAGGERPFRFV